MQDRFRDVSGSMIRVPNLRISWIVGGLLLLFLVWNTVAVVPAGHIGVQVLFGKVAENTLPEGLHLINPLLNVRNMSVRTQEIKETARAPSQEGMTVDLDVSVLYRLNAAKAAQLYRSVGPDYVQVVVEPQIRSVVRGVTASYEAKALYTSEREEIATQMEKHIKPLLDPRGVTVEKILLRSVTLPQILSTAIEQKLEAEQKAEQMKFVLDRERQEAERKRIEAKGISDFQNIVSTGLSESLLRWKGIAATEKLATSTNAKVVVIGSGKDSLPIILGNQ
jgi:regulator of protease activity HflC (stomatin/prohibitin superfamily)